MRHSGTVSPLSQKLDGHDVSGICSKSASKKKTKNTARNQVLIERIGCHDLGTGFFLKKTLTMKYDYQSCGLIIELKKSHVG